MNSLAVRRVGFSIALTSLFTLGLLGCSAADPLAQQTTTPSNPAPVVVKQAQLTIPQGTEMHVTLSTPVGSETSQVGDTLTATTLENTMVGGKIAIPQGSTIRGRVAVVTPGTKGMHISEKGGEVVLSFDHVTTPGGDSKPLSASLTQMASSTGKTAGIIGGSAAGGAILGKILGGGSKDAAIGAVVGGGIGTAIVAGTKGKELKIPAGTDLTLTLDESLKMTDRN